MIPRFLILVLILLLPQALWAQISQLGQANGATVTALNAGENARALELAETAMALTKTGSHPPVDHAFAINNLAYALALNGGEASRVQGLYDTALDLAEAHRPDTDPAVFLILQNAAWHAYVVQEPERGDSLVSALLSAAETTPAYADALGRAIDIYFFNERFAQMAATVDRWAASGLNWTSVNSMDTFRTRQVEGEAQGDIVTVFPLIDARIAIARAQAPDQAEAFAHSTLWTKYFMHYEAGNYGSAADALRVWANTGEMSESEMAEIDTLASDVLTLTQLSSFSYGRTKQLGQAELALAYVEVLPDPLDFRRGIALRELAAAQTGLGLHDAAALSLQRALAIFESQPEPRDETVWVIEDLAANADQRGQTDLALQLYRRADTYDIQVAPFDQAVAALNRTSVLTATGDLDEAEQQLAKAWQAFRGAPDLKRNQQVLEVKLLERQATLASVRGRRAEALEDTARWIATARRLFPEPHPDFALALSNASDLLFFEGETAQAFPILNEAIAMHRTLLPEDDPIAVDTRQRLALLALYNGDTPRAIEVLRDVTRSRQSPAHRGLLGQAAFDFEMLAWALLEDGSPDALDEAFQALQWTQVSRSAEALAMMESRLAAASPDQARLLRQRQDLTEAVARTMSQQLAAYSDPDSSETVRATLRARGVALSDAVRAIDSALADRGLETAGITSVSPLSIAAVQAQLAPDEALVTFVLPGLRPDRIPDVEVSSNFAIAITATEVRAARIPEYARGALQTRISAFRCEIAINEPGCADGQFGALRGSMSLEEPEEEAAPSLNLALAHGLYRDLLGGLEPVIRDKAHLIIVPPGDMLRLPFPALVTSDTATADLAEADWLIKQHALSVLPSVPSFATLRARARSGIARDARMLGVGDPLVGAPRTVACDPAAGNGFQVASRGISNLSQRPTTSEFANPEELRQLSRLPESACELAEISNVFAPDHSQILLREAATETGVKALEASGTLAQFDVLVFATHGLIAGEASATAPGLVLSPPDTATAEDDGLLTAAEIAGLTLNADLVVLSACNTAAGENADQEGLSGLARGFFHAGARALLVTHWPVISQAAVDMTTGLFADLEADPNARTADALRRATLAILEDPAARATQKHPAYWAAFALVGV